MATTTNYSWTTPDDTALVKDGAAAIRTLGTAIDTTVFNNASAAIAKTIVDAKGDIIAATAADTVARLAVGANNTVLTADSSTATGLKWAAPATPASGANLISRTTFSAVSSVDIDSLFSTTYENYLVCAQIQGSADLKMRGRYSTTTHTSANYQFAFCGIRSSSSTFLTRNAFDQTSWDMGGASSQGFFSNLFFYRNQSSEQLHYQGFTLARGNGNAMQGSGFVESSQLWTGLNFFPTSGTITGIVTVYGLAKA